MMKRPKLSSLTHMQTQTHTNTGTNWCTLQEVGFASNRGCDPLVSFLCGLSYFYEDQEGFNCIKRCIIAFALIWYKVLFYQKHGSVAFQNCNGLWALLFSRPKQLLFLIIWATSDFSYLDENDVTLRFIFRPNVLSAFHFMTAEPTL